MICVICKFLVHYSTIYILKVDVFYNHKKSLDPLHIKFRSFTVNLVGIFIFLLVLILDRKMPHVKGTIEFNHFEVFGM